MIIKKQNWLTNQTLRVDQTIPIVVHRKWFNTTMVPNYGEQMIDFGLFHRYTHSQADTTSIGYGHGLKDLEQNELKYLIIVYDNFCDRSECKRQ